MNFETKTKQKSSKDLQKKVIPENEHMMNVHFWVELSPLILFHLVLHGAASDVSCFTNLSKAVN